ncbi:protein SUPPRESSOR OF MAX2 1-like [Impatiens glandulifera]|uniref:protein SUPPRESSOR OF MAX2 1-like n=1 Tax=Impatiens glandulifera TaxID=253017 RepID=UPI001FB09082|nr:protein SUPPRESSOR OF MAX2 1-like [Impatiens glandulifera]
MRAGLSTIQQTLTPEAAGVLNHSIGEAGRRNHGQTTPLHVAATLLASPSGFLRQACIRSHPNSSHPLQCRALELCFSVALERLPTAQNMAVGTEPPISNALMAALKRAQAHQRRGCPEQQQQPLLAVKVELEQLIISILDDPSVSRVMREASFSSPAVKVIIEQSMNSQSGPTQISNQSPIGIMFRPNPNPSPIPIPIQSSIVPNRNLYLNPRLQQQGNTGQLKTDDVKKVFDVMLKSKKRNPVLVGDSQPESIVKEVIRRIEKGEVSEGSLLKNARVITLGRETEMATKIKELGGVIEVRLNGAAGVVIDLGDLKWLVEQVSESGRVAVAEMARLLSRFRHGFVNGVWLIGTATCETYLRCQVYHSSMENDWDLQALPITASSLPPFPSLPGLFQRTGRTGILGNSIESNRIPQPLAAAASRGTRCCPDCTKSYEKEVAESASARPLLPRWLQNAKADNMDPTKNKDDQDAIIKKKWSDKCLHLHPNFQPALGLSNPVRVRTDLALSQPAIPEKKTQNFTEERLKDFFSTDFQVEKFAKAADTVTFKKLLKRLTEKAWWQQEAASSLATALTRCRMGNGKKRSGSSKGDVWLLFTGPDRIAKRKMASVLAEGETPIIICLGSRRDSDTTMGFRGKTALDRIAEAVRNDPFSVILLEDFDESDAIIRLSIRRAMERGRLTDSHGREINLGNVVFILTVKPDNNRNTFDSEEARFSSLASGNWQLRLSVNEEKGGKRRASWLTDEGERIKKPRLSLDLNLMADEDRTDGSHNSSDVTVEHESEGRQFFSVTSVPGEVIENVDETIVFKSLNFGTICGEIKRRITERFLEVMSERKVSIEVEDSVLEKVFGALWLGKGGLDEWFEKVLCPSFEQLRERLSEEGAVVRLELDNEEEDYGERRQRSDCLMPDQIRVMHKI